MCTKAQRLDFINTEEGVTGKSTAARPPHKEDTVVNSTGEKITPQESFIA